VASLDELNMNRQRFDVVSIAPGIARKRTG
jgi:hypothetical protein